MGKAAVFYCSSSDTIDPRFNEGAREAVRVACASGYDIVSGGGNRGTMKVVCDEASRCGAGNTGVLPLFMKGIEHPSLTRLVWTERMSQRKEAMREGTDAAIALPGGIGTADEFFETYTLAKLGQYGGKVIAYNLYGFYDALEALLDHFVATGMLDAESRRLAHFPRNADELKALL